MDYNDYEIPQDLRFYTRDIIDMGGLECSTQIPPSALEGMLSAPNKITKARIKLKFSPAGKEILVQGFLDGKAQLQCARCLDNFEAPFAEEFTEMYPTKGEIIDIMSVTKQTLALLEGIQNVCSPACKGLCAYCGCNKNTTACDCKPPALSPFACLKDKFKK